LATAIRRPATGNQLDWTQLINRNGTPVVSVKMRKVMLTTSLKIHPDNNAKESRNFRHNLQIISRSNA
jgi:hypothetical protein